MSIVWDFSVTRWHYDEICKSVPTEYGSKCYGYHKECYSKFTNLKYLKAIKWKSDQDPEVELSIKKKIKFINNIHLWFLFICENTPELILPGKFLSSESWTCKTETAGKTFKEGSERRSYERMLCKVIDVDLKAREAKYHDECRNAHKYSATSMQEYMQEKIPSVSVYSSNKTDKLKKKMINHFSPKWASQLRSY